jgi:hypothetical protein
MGWNRETARGRSQVDSRQQHLSNPTHHILKPLFDPSCGKVLSEAVKVLAAHGTRDTPKLLELLYVRDPERTWTCHSFDIGVARLIGPAGIREVRTPSSPSHRAVGFFKYVEFRV